MIIQSTTLVMSGLSSLSDSIPKMRSNLTALDLLSTSATMLNIDDILHPYNTLKNTTYLNYSVDRSQAIPSVDSATTSASSTFTDTTDTLQGNTSLNARVYRGDESGLQPWEFQTVEECTTHHHRQDSHLVIQDGWCNSTFDSYLCWPPTAPHSRVRLQCPPGIKGVDHTKLAERECLAGDWRSSKTDYSPCILPELRGFLNGNDVESKMAVASSSRTLEIVGLSFSLCAILLSIVIFCYFRSLRNNRTRMHVNLFVAMMIQIVVRLTVYIDQYVTRKDNLPKTFGIDNTAILCESFYVLLEYARTAMFMWMFIEGLYLHSMLTITVFSSRPNFKCYYVLGWGLPLLMTAVWATVTAIVYTQTVCWWGYNLSPYFWILEGPRLAIILTNFLFLLNILRVLITKMKASASTETQQVKKAVRAAIVLLPLLGITNGLQMVVSPHESETKLFALWSFLSTFLTSFQGFFVALIYCLLNQEVRQTLGKFFTNHYRRQRLTMYTRRFSMSTNIQSEAIPMTISIRPCPPVLAVICEASSEKDAMQSPETSRPLQCRNPSEIQRPSEPPKPSYRPHAPLQPDSSSLHQMLSDDSVMPQGHSNNNVLIGANNGGITFNNRTSRKGSKDFEGNENAEEDQNVNVNLNVIVNLRHSGTHGNFAYSDRPKNEDNLPAPSDSTLSSTTSPLLETAGNVSHRLDHSLVTKIREPASDHNNSSKYSLVCDHNPTNL